MADGGGFDPDAVAALVPAPADPDLVARLPAATLLSEGFLPWRRHGAEVLVLCREPAAAAMHLDDLRRALGPVRLVRVEAAVLDRALTRDVGRPLVAAAEGRAPLWASCRSLPRGPLGRWALAAALAAAAGLVAAPLGALAAASLVAALALVLSSLLKLAAVAATLRRKAAEDGAEVIPARLPTVTVFVPLYRERAVAHHLLARMAALDYPRDRLDLCLLLEDDDAQTRAALGEAPLPPWARVVQVPEGTLRTKPRALNYGLAFAKGSIVGIYDAEDLPAPDHLRRVALTFARRGPDVACLQGALDYFNTDRNWLSRCFAIEYAMWFRVLLPGFERLGLVVPLGGTNYPEISF